MPQNKKISQLPSGTPTTSDTGVIVQDGVTKQFSLANLPVSTPIQAAINAGGAVTSVNSKVGDVVLTTDDIADSSNKRYVTDANLITIGNQSGTNSGDETVTTIKSKLGITTLSGSNTGDEDVTSIKSKLGITTLSGSNTGDQDLSGLMVKSNNLSDLTNTTTARSNLGLGSLATQSGTFSGTSSGTNTGDQTLSDATISTTDITTNDVTNTKHGFFPKLPSITDNKTYGIKNGTVSEVVGGGGSPGGTSGQLQFNNTVFGGAEIEYSANCIGSGQPGLLLPDSSTQRALFIYPGNATASSDENGGSLGFSAGNGDGNGNGGDLILGNIEGATMNGGATGNGGNVFVTSGLGGATSGSGGDIQIQAGFAQGGDSNGGNITLTPGVKSGAGADGNIILIVPSSDPGIPGALYHTSGTLKISL